MWSWVETLLRIEVIVFLTIVAIAAPIVLVMMALAVLDTYRRNRQ
jgi:hypothetical protein